ncbi:hypothetical protein K503DRAFT_350413 [Rhizopogon vinicolor AM-OR11-026]|uniref:Uncharacterized protein n=1 Tax=Rhizopogon vinicolor AM-OR11-026 TaxID=1314800 RepID=A0A1B7MSW9_9AGAM|nr:hypothetical protein K503DRAFT_350413 [Rhizopogon vinicolor AM-OR11-026]
MLASCQSEASTVDKGMCDSSADLQAMFGETLRTSYWSNELSVVHPLAFEHLQGQLSDQEYEPLSQESVNTLQEREDPPFHQLAPGSPMYCQPYSSKRLP